MLGEIRGVQHAEIGPDAVEVESVEAPEVGAQRAPVVGDRRPQRYQFFAFTASMVALKNPIMVSAVSRPPFLSRSSAFTRA